MTDATHRALWAEYQRLVAEAEADPSGNVPDWISHRLNRIEREMAKPAASLTEIIAKTSLLRHCLTIHKHYTADLADSILADVERALGAHDYLNSPRKHHRIRADRY